MRQDLKYKLDTLLKLLQKEEFKMTYQLKNVAKFFILYELITKCDVSL